MVCFFMALPFSPCWALPCLLQFDILHMTEDEDKRCPASHLPDAQHKRFLELLLENPQGGLELTSIGTHDDLSSNDLGYVVSVSSQPRPR